MQTCVAPCTLLSVGDLKKWQTIKVYTRKVTKEEEGKTGVREMRER